MRPEAITPDNTLSNIIVSSMVDSPLSSLYHAVQKVKILCCICICVLEIPMD